MKIVIDTLGSDKGAAEIVAGVIEAVKINKDITPIFFGVEEEISSAISSLGQDPKDYSIVNAPEVITGEDKPTDAIRLKKEASMIKAIKTLREDDSIDALISTGATGALVVAATLRIGRIRGIRRPAFCPILPTIEGGTVGVCDSGANAEATPEMLCQFAILGSMYLECYLGKKSPRVALLNIGTESEKGDNLRKEAYQMLKNLECINFVGNMESRDLLSGKYDLIVSDGFSGNVLIKSMEGTALLLLKKIKNDIYSKTIYKLGALLMKKMFKEEKEFMNYQNYGGSVLLGCDKIIVKGHGSSDRNAIKVCVDQAYKMHTTGLLKKIEEQAEKYIN